MSQVVGVTIPQWFSGPAACYAENPWRLDCCSHATDAEQTFCARAASRVPTASALMSVMLDPLSFPQSTQPWHWYTLLTPKLVNLTNLQELKLASGNTTDNNMPCTPSQKALLRHHDDMHDDDRISTLAINTKCDVPPTAPLNSYNI